MRDEKKANGTRLSTCSRLWTNIEFSMLFGSLKYFPAPFSCIDLCVLTFKTRSCAPSGWARTLLIPS